MPNMPNINKLSTLPNKSLTRLFTAAKRIAQANTISFQLSS